MKNKTEITWYKALVLITSSLAICFGISNMMSLFIKSQVSTVFGFEFLDLVHYFVFNLFCVHFVVEFYSFFLGVSG